MMKVFAILAAVIVATAPSAAAQQDRPPALLSFEFLGCSGDFEGHDSRREVWRLTGDGNISFLTHTVAACGLSGRAPVIAGNSGSLDLSYELYSPTDVAIMCECEYWARFTFGPDAHTVKSVTFGGDPVVLKGTWPGR